jgi:DNA-binding response OmpR family regulator
MPDPASRLSDKEQTAIRILVVDDEPLIADTLVSIFRQYGYSALASYGGRDALGKAEEFSPDLMVTDVVMPDVDGIEVALRVKARWPQCRIVLLTGQTISTDLAEKAQGLSSGFEVLEKPIQPLELLARVQEILGPHSNTEEMYARRKSNS